MFVEIFEQYYLHKSILIKSLKVSDLMYLSTFVNSYLCVMRVDASYTRYEYNAKMHANV